MAGANRFNDYAFVSIGSNLPFALSTPLDIIALAFAELEQLSPPPILTSSIYITSPVDSPAGTPDFYNAMAGIIPQEGETPLTFLRRLQAIENEAGRKRSGIINEARTLDLDLITFRDTVLATDELTLPHPRAHQRRFVLEPLMEIAGGEYCLPGGFDENVEELLVNISRDQHIQKA